MYRREIRREELVKWLEDWLHAHDNIYGDVNALADALLSKFDLVMESKTPV